MSLNNINLFYPITAYFRKDFSKNIKKNDLAVIDKLKYEIACESHIMMRVVNKTKKPIYFDSHWFKDFNKFKKDK